MCATLIGMTPPDLITLIDAEIAILQQARTLIAGALPTKQPGRPKSKKRNLTPEGRARIAAAVKARWAAQKKAAK